MPNRAQRRAMQFRAAQPPGQPASAESAATNATSSDGRRTLLLALGLQVDANNNFFVPADAKIDAKAELLPYIHRVDDAVNVIAALPPLTQLDAEAAALVREWTAS